MKIIRRCTAPVNIEDFADRHDLVMVVAERYHNRLAPYYAYFEAAEGSMLCSTFGDGHSEREAISNYCKEIAGRVLVVNAYDQTNRKEIAVPRMLYYAPPPAQP